MITTSGKPKCSEHGCNRQQIAATHDLCKVHRKIQLGTAKGCTATIDGVSCTGIQHANALCGMHYTQMKVHGAIISMEATPGRKDNALDPFSRFASKIVPNSNTGCWLWDGPLGDDGYPRFSDKGTTYRAHRWLWRELVNPGLTRATEIDHVGCSIKCVRPAHLQEVTRARHHEITVHRRRVLSSNTGKVFISEREAWNVAEVLFAKTYGLP